MNTQAVQAETLSCANIEEAREQIDTIDQAIINMLALRYQYVQQVAEYKQPTAADIKAEDRRQQVLQDRRQWAAEAGLDPDVIESLWDRLIAYFIQEEMKIKNI